MSFDRGREIRIYDPKRRRQVSIEALITKLGIRAIAKKYKVTESAVRKWRKGIRKPSLKTMNRLWKELF